MRKAAIERVEAEYLIQDRPVFYIGDTVDIGVRIREGEKERTQVFTGVVIARRGVGAAETFTIRRIIAGEGVERTFPLHSPSVAFIRTIRSGKVRRAKIHYLRDRVGKATRLAEVRRNVGAARRAKAADTEARAEPADQPADDSAPAGTAEGADESAEDAQKDE